MLPASIPRVSYSDSGSRPGLTSLIKTGRGVMTIQTEIVGEPARLSTIVDFRGRVLKTWQSSFLVGPEDFGAARSWHRKIEQEVRESLERVAKHAPDRGASVGACLFVAGMRAYATRDYDRARTILDVCAQLVRGDARIEAALARLRSVE